MVIRAVLFDAPGVIYDRPEIGIGLQTLLDHYSLKPRHPSVVRNTLRAALYDANVGRIKLDDFFNAILRTHGLAEPQAMSAGREALRFDASRLTLANGTGLAIRNLAQNGLKLGALVNSPYRASDEVAWLARLGVPANVWALYETSCESGVLMPDLTLIEQAVRKLDLPPTEIALVSRDLDCLEVASAQGINSIAFQPTVPLPTYALSITHLSDLAPIFAQSY
jgi:FMN phosphatase YigB (HAD superfamily)